MLLLGKQILGSTYVKLLVAFENISTDIFLDSLSNITIELKVRAPRKKNCFCSQIFIKFRFG